VLSAAFLLVALQQIPEVRAQPLAWDALAGSAFDPAWILPERRRGARDLLEEMERLASARIAVDLGDDRMASAFADLVVAARARPDASRAEWLAQLASESGWARDWSAGLRELLLDEHLRSDEWDPLRDHARDGLLIADDWELEPGHGAPWSELDVVPRFAQAAALIHADLATIKAVENDYRAYPAHVGADYEEIFPVRERFFRGEDPLGAPFAALAIRFASDLPFPFTGYSCGLRILNRIDAAGVASTDIYSTSSDFHYLAGRDVYLPVADARGATVAFLVVRLFGFDLVGVPDEPAHRVMALRTSLGNLKRNAEARFRAAPRPFGSPAAALAGFRVLGGD
jgi:hypothetical protein